MERVINEIEESCKLNQIPIRGSVAFGIAPEFETWGADQRISVEEALRVNTINGAYASHEEAIKGSITPGKPADFVVLTDDPHTVDKDKIKDIAIVRTVTGGNTVYQA